MAATLAAGALLAAGCTADGPDPDDTASRPPAASGSGGSAWDPAALAAGAAALPQRSVGRVDATRLAEGLVPPTNRWFSALALGPDTQPVFAPPWSFRVTGTGFALGVPRVSTTARTIAGPASSDLEVTVPGTASSMVTAYDDVSVTVELRDRSGAALGHVVVVAGSLSMTFTAARESTLALGTAVTGSPATATVDGRTYGLVLGSGTPTGTSVRLAQGGTATWFVVPDGVRAADVAPLAQPVSGGTATYAVTPRAARTTIGYRSTDERGAVVAMPHQWAGLADRSACDLGTIPSIYGTLHVCRGTSLSWSTPVHPVTDALDLSALTAADTERLTRQVEEDAARAEPFPADTYFGGKALQRGVQLYVLARDLGLTDVAEGLRTRLVGELDTWTQPAGCAQRTTRCVVYDPKAHGVVGLEASFGSEEFNDHHFHYGYFLYAAGILAAEDPDLAARWSPVLDLLAADIAATGAAPTFPDRRVFDPYAGHSWASGTAPFADGNNQESSSEAVNAWIGLSLWATARGNTALRAEATWMLANEQDTALRYQLRLDRRDPVYRGFDHDVTSLLWGGKRDYATWFSPDPGAMLGILVLPASPSSAGYLRGDPEAIRAAVDEASEGGRYARQFGDYLLMYRALAGEEDRIAALRAAESLDPRWIDDGNSRSALMAWLMTGGAISG